MKRRGMRTGGVIRCVYAAFACACAWYLPPVCGEGRAGEAAALRPERAEASPVADPHQPKPGEERRLVIGILDFSAPGQLAWTGTAIAEGIYTKLLSVPGVQVVERQRLRELLHQGLPAEPAKLGCAVLVTGTVQHTGVWPEGRLRVSLKLIAAEDGLVRGDASMVLDDAASGLFRIEDELARRTGEALNRPPAAGDLARRNGLTLSSEEEYSVALEQLARAHELPAERRTQARELASEAVTHFQQAQKRNGAFFPAAHSGEGAARELLAQLQDDPQAGKTLRAQTADKFRADAADAAPAFYDLGRVLQDTGDYPGALQAYRDFRAWMSAQNRVLVWEYPMNSSGDISYYTGFDRVLRCCANSRDTFLFQDIVVAFPGKGKAIGVDVASGAERWRLQLEGEGEKEPGIRRLLWMQSHFYLVDNAFRLLRVDTRSGQITARTQLPFHKHEYTDSYRLQIGITDGDKPRIVVRQFANYGHEFENNRFDELAAYDPVNLERLWLRKGRNLYKNQIWLVGGMIVLKQMEEKNIVILDPQTGAEAPDGVHPAILHLMGFEHEMEASWFADPAGGGWLCKAQFGEEQGAQIWRIHDFRSPAQPAEAIAGALMNREVYDGLVFYLCGKPAERGNRILYREPEGGQTRFLELGAQQLERVGCGKPNGGRLLTIAVRDGSLSMFRDWNLMEIYDTRQTWNLLWRYLSTQYFFRPPLLLENGLVACLHSFDKSKACLARIAIPQSNQTIHEATALTREGECLQKLGQETEALKAFSSALRITATASDAAYGAAGIYLAQGKPFAAWEQARLFLREAAPSDPRREELWRTLADACGVVQRGTFLSWPGMRYEREGGRLLSANGDELRVTDIGAEPAREVVRQQKLQEEHAILSVRDNVMTVFCGEYENPPEARLLRYRLEDLSETGRRVVPGYRRVKVAFWDTMQAMREEMDHRPHLLHDTNAGEHFLLIDPQTLQTTGEFWLREPLLPWRIAMHHDEGNGLQSAEVCYEVPVQCFSADGVLVLAGYAPDEVRPHYVLAGWSLAENRLLWQRSVALTGGAERYFKNWAHGMQVQLVALGSRFLFSATKEDRWISFDTLTGIPSGQFPAEQNWPLRLPYLLPLAQLLNPRAWVDTAPYQGANPQELAYGSSPLWENGPVLLENRDSGKALAIAEAVTGRPLCVQEDAPFMNGVLVAPPFTFALVRMIYNASDFLVLRNDVPFYGRTPAGAIQPCPGSVRPLPPLLTRRKDYVPRYPVPGQTPATNAEAVKPEASRKGTP